MFIASSDYGELQSKGVTEMMKERDEGGFFQKVVSVHPWARRTQTVSLGPGHELHEFGPDFFPLASRFRWVRRLFAPLIVARSALRIRAAVRDTKISLVQASDPFWTALVAWFATRRSRSPLVVSIHADWNLRSRLDRGGVPKFLGSFRLALVLARFILRQADSVIVIREHLRREAIRLGASEKTVFVLPHVVDDELFVESANQSVDQAALPYAFFAGRLSRENYVYDMLESVRRLPQELPLRLMLAGAGVERETIATLVASDPILSSRVVMLGSLPRESLQVWREQAAVNVCLMGGFSLIEATAAARPVVAYDVEWHSELVLDGETGFLVGEGDIEAVSDALVVCVRRPDYAKQLGMAAQERARKRHSRSSVGDLRRQVYDQILERWEAPCGCD